MEKPNRQVHLGCAEDYTKQLLEFFDFGIVGGSPIKLNHALDNIWWIVSFEIPLDVLVMFDRVGDRIEIPLLRKIPKDDVADPVFKEPTR
jgi:hypothetical protein